MSWIKRKFSVLEIIEMYTEAKSSEVKNLK